MKILFVIPLIFIVLVAGCIGQAPAREPYLLLKDGTSCIEYEFKNDIYKILEVPVYGKITIQQILFIAPKINLLFESQPDDNPGFALAGFAIVNKLATWNSYAVGRILSVDRFDISNETVLAEQGFYNRTGIDILLRGPNTGANDTYVLYANKTIIVQGLNTSSIEIAGERLALLMLEDLVNNTQEESLYLQRCKV